MSKEPNTHKDQEKDTKDSKSELTAVMIPVDLLDPDPNNPRTMEFTEEEEPGLEELAASMKSVGIISPLTVVKVGNRYRIVAGHRRTQAAKMAGIREVPAVIHREETPEKSLIMQIVENVQRQKLAPKDLCSAVLELKHDHGMSATEIAKNLGRSKSWVTFLLSVGESEGLAKKAVDEGLINDMTWAYQFSTLPKDTQQKIYDTAKESGGPIKRSTIEAAKNPPPVFYPPATEADVVPRQPIERQIELPVAAFQETPFSTESQESPTVSVSQEYGTVSVRAPLDNVIRFLKSVGRPVDTDEQIVRGIQEMFS